MNQMIFHHPPALTTTSQPRSVVACCAIVHPATTHFLFLLYLIGCYKVCATHYTENSTFETLFLLVIVSVLKHRMSYLILPFSGVRIF
ncbi:uncharacterized protein EV420DRAFT_1589984 [Desarmillaria tabescens]|uniref:Uncharacterized protein n=1 Tax=Armillaria tabescens TaxID=1929756 RepID=A0AA39J620_ARMTA|nr:uncharacterized protein EV420DRAFT_1589984 [Desarmillaria tabescens]KAK0436807.1 hypothetical protein EV420DRAFT_1589984 [Desarmillaria tabescens]